MIDEERYNRRWKSYTLFIGTVKLRARFARV